MFSQTLYVPGGTTSGIGSSSTSYVGIGTSSPQDKLDIAAPNRQLRLTDTDDSKFWQLSASSKVLAFRYQEDQDDEQLALWLNQYGNVGIGTSSPQTRLEIAGANKQLRLTDTDDSKFWQVSASANVLAFRYQEDQDDEQLALWLDQHGYVGIGCSNPDARLTVNGGMKAESVDIIYDVPSSDYVFEADYNLRSLAEVEQYVKAHKKLPEVPSAAEFKANGYSVGQMDDILLRKVEELTLYTIKQDKQIAEQEKELEAKDAVIQDLIKRIEALEKK